MSRSRRDLRREAKILAAVAQYGSTKTVAEKCNLSERSVRRYKERARTQIPPADDIYAAVLAEFENSENEQLRAKLLTELLRAATANSPAPGPRRRLGER